jgi:soluble lytic murein transglycosylase
MTRRGTKQLSRVGRRLTRVLLLGVAAAAGFVYVRWLYREQRWNRLIEEIAPRYGVDKFLVKAVMRQESGFDPFAYSRKGAIGLMQVMPGTGQDWATAVGRADFGRDSLWDARVNIEAGAWYLARAQRRWPDKTEAERVPFVLAEYNAGYGNVLKWLPNGRATTAAELIEAITYPGVRHYIEKISAYYADYSARGEL